MNTCVGLKKIMQELFFFLKISAIFKVLTGSLLTGRNIFKDLSVGESSEVSSSELGYRLKAAFLKAFVVEHL